jgi:hypothetical protein
MTKSDTSVNFEVVNETDIPEAEILAAIQEQVPYDFSQEFALLNNWIGGQHRNRGLADRDRYVTPGAIFDQFKVAKKAISSDDVVAGVAETTEALAFDRMRIFCEDQDEENIWNQIADDLDLESRMREVWRELFAYSQAYVAKFPGRKSYKVDGKSDTTGTKRKKTFNSIAVPQAITLMDPIKIIPVGNFMFNQDELAYVADLNEIQAIESTLAETNSTIGDPIIRQLFTQKYKMSAAESTLVRSETGLQFVTALDNTYLLNPDNVFRITATRPQYQRFADCRMTSVFELLDLKYQLRQMDRVHLIGGINFILLVKRGSKEFPVKPAELAKTAAQVRSNARVPIIAGDHTLEVEIVTPKLDKTLSPERYNGIDARISARLYNIFNAGNYTAGTANDDSIKLMRVVAKSMETRRNLIAKHFMKNIIMPIYEANDSLTSKPKIKFEPGQINMSFDPNIAVYYQDLRDRGEVSQATTLAQIGVLVEDEAILREREKKYADIFTPINVPFSGNQADPNSPGGSSGPTDPKTPSPAPTKPSGPGNTKGAGRRGGGKTGGGGTTRNSVKSNPGRGPSTSRLQDALESNDDLDD